MLKAADLFQAQGLLKHCLEGFRGGADGAHGGGAAGVGAQARAGGGEGGRGRVLCGARPRCAGACVVLAATHKTHACPCAARPASTLTVL